MQLKKYFKYDELNQKFYNSFLLSLELCLYYKENFDGSLIEKHKTIDYKKFIPNFLNDFQNSINKMNKKILKDIMYVMEMTVNRLSNIQDKICITDTLFIYHLKSRASADNITQIFVNNGQVDKRQATSGINSLTHNRSDTTQDFSSKLRLFSLTLLETIFKIMNFKDLQNFRESIEFSNNLPFNLIIHVFQSLSNDGRFISPQITKMVKKYVNGSEGLNDNQKEMGKYEYYILRFYYKMAKSCQVDDLYDLLYNLIASKYSIKGSLISLKELKGSMEHRTHLVINFQFSN